MTTTDGADSAGQGAGSPPGQALAHGLRWALKRSFVDYVRRMPDGKGWVGDGAVPVGTDEMFFALDTENSAPTTADAPERRVLAFAGDVRFTGHFGMLFVRVARPWLEVDGDLATLTVDDPHGDAAAPRVALVTARLERLADQDGTAIVVGLDVRLTEAAVGIFNEVYPAGEPFEDFAAQVPSLLWC